MPSPGMQYRTDSCLLYEGECSAKCRDEGPASNVPTRTTVRLGREGGHHISTSVQRRGQCWEREGLNYELPGNGGAAISRVCVRERPKIGINQVLSTRFSPFVHRHIW